MASRSEFARSMMCRTARFGANKTGRYVLKQLQQLPASDRTIEGNCAVTRDPMNLEDVLPKIRSYCRDFHGGAPFLTEDNFCRVPQSAILGADTIHPSAHRSLIRDCE